MMGATQTRSPVISMPEQEERYVAPQLELSLGGCQIHGASIGSGPDGTNFAFTIGPISDETLAALDGTAQDHGRVRVLFPQPLLLDLVALERKDPQQVRIVGRIVQPVKASE
jgi:hypothetical protein